MAILTVTGWTKTADGAVELEKERTTPKRAAALMIDGAIAALLENHEMRDHYPEATEREREEITRHLKTYDRRIRRLLNLFE